METHVVMMAGGIGSRFWPMSTPGCPKQFLDVLGVGKTMIQQTYARFLPLCPPGNMWVVTGAAYVDLVRAQLPELPPDHILAEPVARNTAPCIAYACWRIGRQCPDANIVVTPADAFIRDVEAFRQVIRMALADTAGSGHIVTVGIRPDRPETGYGYIHAAAEPAEGVRKVLAFKEKPDFETAVSYLASGQYLWNAGIFVWRLATIQAAIRRYVPGIADVMDALAARAFSAGAVAELFPACEKISIDYAVMEKSPDIYTVPGDFGWSDLGTWGSLLQHADRDGEGNARTGENVRTFGCTGTVVHVSSLREVVLEGLHDYIVAEKDGRLLVCRLSEEQRIKDFHD
ncbi:MAG: mannose-1-phosphate guanylyltransferase [Bacteroidales bacterium]|nr:mannose-1-phosphate guanylyltransferase [Bacteroidales bacterium]